MVGPSKGRPPMSHRKTDLGILCRSKICQSSARPCTHKSRALVPEGSGGLLPPSPPAEKATASKDQAGKASTCDGTGYQLASDFTTRKIVGVNVKISHVAL